MDRSHTDKAVAPTTISPSLRKSGIRVDPGPEHLRRLPAKVAFCGGELNFIAPFSRGYTISNQPLAINPQ